MEEASVGTKREDCEAVLDGVGLGFPAKSSYSTSYLNFSFFAFISPPNKTKNESGNWGENVQNGSGNC